MGKKRSISRHEWVKDNYSRYMLAKLPSDIEEAAKILGVSPRQVYNYIKGSRLPSLEVLLRIKHFFPDQLQVSIEYYGSL
jgi:transcriptional regulator with XRE-family HTH domain